jgi:hypothetical protein
MTATGSLLTSLSALIMSLPRSVPKQWLKTAAVHTPIWVVSCIAVLLVPMSSLGRTWIVAQQGGDFTVLSAACNAAASGDTVLTRPGDYQEPGNHFIYIQQKALVIRGTGLRPEDVSLSVLIGTSYCRDILFENLRFHDHWRCLILSNSTTTIRNCLFEDNWSIPDDFGAEAAAVTVGEIGNQCLIEDCVFRRNHSLYEHYDPEEYCGGAAIYAGVEITIRRCWFEENTSGSHGGAIWAGYHDTIEDCVFVRNVAPNGAAITLSRSGVTRCTFYANETTVAFGGACIEVIDDTVPEEITLCIVDHTVNGYGIGTWGAAVTWCCDLWANDRGSTVGDCYSPIGLANFSADPLFCDAPSDDFTLDAASPCLPGEHGGYSCDLVGARQQMCGEVPTLPMSWGRIKNMFAK